MLYFWPMKFSAQMLYPRGLRFPVPLDKGNEGSGNEIGTLLNTSRARHAQSLIQQCFLTVASKPTLLPYIVAVSVVTS